MAQTKLKLLYDEQSDISKRITQCEQELIMEIIEKYNSIQEIINAPTIEDTGTNQNKMSLSDVVITKYAVTYDQLCNLNNFELQFENTQNKFTILKKITCVEIGLGGNYRCNLIIWLNARAIYIDTTKDTLKKIYTYNQRCELVNINNNLVMNCLLDIINIINQFKPHYK